jgi:hypothetical protein
MIPSQSNGSAADWSVDGCGQDALIVGRAVIPTALSSCLPVVNRECVFENRLGDPAVRACDQASAEGAAEAITIIFSKGWSAFSPLCCFLGTAVPFRAGVLSRDNGATSRSTDFVLRAGWMTGGVTARACTYAASRSPLAVSPSPVRGGGLTDQVPFLGHTTPWSPALTLPIPLKTNFWTRLPS